MYDLLIQDATIIRSGSRVVADIGIEDGRIAYIGDRPAGRARENVPAIGRFVMPGAIDASVRLGGAEDWRSLSRGAAASGVTCLLELSDATDEESVRARRAVAEGASLVSHGLWGRATADNAEELAALGEAGLICGSRVDLSQLSDAGLAAHFQAGARLLGVHLEDRDVLAAARASLADEVSPEHNAVRPPQAVLQGLERILPLIEETRQKTHLFSVSTAAEISRLDPTHGELPLSCEVCPNHLFLSVETSRRNRVSHKIVPPVRSELDRRAMWAAIKRGRLDTFTSGHVPNPRPSAAQPYWDTPAGLPGIDTLLRLLLVAVKNGRMSLELMVRMAAEAPAELLGLRNKGRVEEGADADLVLFAEGRTTRLEKSGILSAAGWSPYIGRELSVPPLLVLVGGRVVARDGRLVDDSSPRPAVQLSAM